MTTRRPLGFAPQRLPLRLRVPGGFLGLVLSLSLAACDTTPELRALVPDSVARAANDDLAGFNPTRRSDVPANALRVCGDPNNLPFSNARLQGFENELIALIAAELGRDTVWTWFPQRRGFARKTLRAGECDVIAGVPSSYELALTTNPYYRSTYVFVTRADRALDVSSLDDAGLRGLRIGLHTIGDDYSNTPGAEALARRGLGENVVGYSVYGNYGAEHPTTDLIEAVARGDIDVAIAWGPIAGWAAAQDDTPLRLEPVTPRIDPPFTPFVFDMSMAVRRDDVQLRDQLDAALARRAPEIRAILERYDVPIVETGLRRMEAGR